MKTTETKPFATIEVLNEVNDIMKKMAEKPLGQELADRLYTLENDYNWFDQPFEDNGRYGVKDVFGNVIVPAKFDDYVEMFNSRFRLSAIPMMLDGKAVLVKADGSGDVIEGTAYDTIHYTPYIAVYRMWNDGKFGFMTPTGNVFVDCICDKYYEPSNGVLEFESAGKIGLIFFDGTVIAPKFDEVDVIELDELIKVRVGDEWGYIDKNGEFTTDEDNAIRISDDV